MSFHLGNDFFISSKQLVSIINIQELKSSCCLLQMLAAKQGSDRVRAICGGKHRSVVITKNNIYFLSPIDSKTLAKRIKMDLQEYSGGK
jgi:regulator of extracellular matrix RemA (YlzA/DUF370 family)